MRKIVVFFVILAVFGALSAWDEFNRYSIADELRKPGVKLVAVDFYATWCEPCNAAIPKWKKLQEKYGDKGFKLIVVSVQSEGSCSQPPQWTPDKIVCDYDGDIANAWHANNLPQAFLWSWQGNLLVAHGGVDDVASAIEKYFERIPRVYVEEGNDENLYKMVRSELIKNSKIEIVASDEERAALAELRKKSAELNYDKKLQCKLGEEVSANSRLVISTQQRGSKEALVLELFSAEKGCLAASGTATMRGNPETEVAEAVFNLLKNLLGDVKMPGEDGKQVKVQKPAAQSSNFQDALACEQARKASSDFVWQAYLKNYPAGECVAEAKEELDKSACRKAEENKSVDGWKAYLKEYTNGLRAVQAQAEIQKSEAEQAVKAAKTNEKEKYHPYKTAGISLIVAGAVVAAAGVASFHILSDKEYDKYKKMAEHSSTLDAVSEGVSYDDYIDKADKRRKKSNTYRILEISGGALGGALLVTGVVLTVIKKDKPDDGKIALSNFSVAPANDGFYATLGFEF